MAQVHVIRHKVLVEGLSIRRVAREMGVSRNTVSKYLKEAQPIRREGPRRKPVLERVAPRIDELLLEWSSRTTPKQRITGTRVHRQLREEGYEVGTTTVRTHLREKRRQAAEVYIPLVHHPGDVAQVLHVNDRDAGLSRPVNQSPAFVDQVVTVAWTRKRNYESEDLTPSAPRSCRLPVIAEPTRLCY